MELVQQLIQSLGVNEDQAKGGAGLLLKLAREKLGGGDFAKVAQALPEAENLIQEAPEAGGLAGAVKGLAAASGARVVGVGSLEALAWPLAVAQCPVVAMIDARRGEIYHTTFRGDNGRPVAVAPAAVSAPDAVADRLPQDAILVGSGAVLYRRTFEKAPIRFADDATHIIRAASVGLLAMERIDDQETDALDGLVPDYVRKSDAQIHMAGSC